MNLLWYFHSLTVEQIRIAQKFWEFYQRCGRRPYLYEFGRGCERIGLPQMVEVLRVFRSLDDAYRAADIPVAHVENYDRIHAVRMFYDKYQRVPTMQEARSGMLLYHLNTLVDNSSYSYWNELIADAGLTPRIQTNKTEGPPVKELISDVQKLTLELGRLPSLTNIQRSPMTASAHWYKKKIGDLEAIHKAAKLRELLGMPETRREEMVQFLQDKAAELGHSPTRRELIGERISTKMLENEFGSRRAAYTAAGLTLPREKSKNEHFIQLLLESPAKRGPRTKAQHAVDDTMSTQELAISGAVTTERLEALPTTWEISEEILNASLLSGDSDLMERRRA